MSIPAVSLGRVSENLKAYRLLESLRQNTLKLFTEQNRLSTGRQLLTPSENPGGAATAMRMKQLLDQQDQILANLKAADGFLSATDQAVQDISTLLIQAQELASEHAGGLTDQDQRDAAAIVVSSLIDQLVMIGNRTYQGRYLFGGRLTTAAPFVREEGVVRYVGDVGDLRTLVDGTQEQAYNVDGNRLFGALSTQVRGWKDWDVRLTADTRVTDCRGTTGRGIALGSVRITETGVGTFTVDLTQADRVGDVLDLINQAAADAGSSVTASINPSGNGIQITSGGATIEVAEAGNGTTARDLGILTSGPVPVVLGSDIDPKLTERTRLQDLGGVTLANLAAGFIICSGEHSVVIDTGSMVGTNTVQDLLNLINRSGAGVRAGINATATGIDVLNCVSGRAMRIGENGGDAAAELGLRSMYAGTPLAELNGGKGVSGLPGQADFRIVARNGSYFDVDINDAAGGLDHNGDGFETLDDVIDAINAAAAGAGVAVTASLATTGNGIRLVDTTGVDGTLRVERLNLSYAVDDLGLTDLQAAGAGASVEAVGQDVNGIVPPGVFTALQRLYDALISGDTKGITEAGNAVQRLLGEVNGVLGEVGARAKAMSDRRARTEEAVDATRKVLSEVEDLDYTQAITRFQQAQVALQANLMTGSLTLNLSLLDFLK